MLSLPCKHFCTFNADVTKVLASVHSLLYFFKKGCRVVWYGKNSKFNAVLELRPQVTGNNSHEYVQFRQAISNIDAWIAFFYVLISKRQR